MRSLNPYYFMYPCTEIDGEVFRIGSDIPYKEGMDVFYNVYEQFEGEKAVAFADFDNKESAKILLKLLNRG